MNSTYVSSNSFTVLGDKTLEFILGRRIKADCGIDGIKYVTILSSSFVSPNTTVIIKESILTINLSSVLVGIVISGDMGSLPEHTHTSSGDGGEITYSFIDLSDVPASYVNNRYVKTTTSGLYFANPIIYGTGDPPDPSEYEEGTIYLKYTL